MISSASQLLVALGLCLAIYHLPRAEALNCYTDVTKTVQEDCQMHTGCEKKFYVKTQKAISRGCFLTPGKNDTCFVEPDTGLGVCWCHSDLCNSSPNNVRGQLIMGLILPLMAYLIIK